MNPIRKIKAWRDQRFQRRVLKVLGAELINNGNTHAIVFKDDVMCGDVPTINTDEIHEHEHDCGVPV